MNVAAEAPDLLSNEATVSGGGSEEASAVDAVAVGNAVLPPVPVSSRLPVANGWNGSLSANDLAVDGNGNLYVTDLTNHWVWRMDAALGTFSKIAGSDSTGFDGDGGPATSAVLSNPYGVAVDSAGNVYIADTSNHRIRKVTAETGVITTIAGGGTAGLGDGGPATSANLSYPQDVACDAGGTVYIADTGHNRIRKVDGLTGTISTVAGGGTGGLGDGGPATSAQLDSPLSVVVDSEGNLHIAEYAAHRVRKVTAITGIITTAAGTGAGGYNGDGLLATTAQLFYPQGVAVDQTADLYVADRFNHRVRSVAAATGLISTVAGNGSSDNSGDGWLASLASVPYPRNVAVDGVGTLFVTDLYGYIRKVAAAVCPVRLDTPTGAFTAAGGSGTLGFTGFDPSCPWTALSGADWITLAPGSESGAGSGSVGYTVAANPYSAPRTGAVVLGLQTHTVTQGGVACAYLPESGRSNRRVGRRLGNRYGDSQCAGLFLGRAEPLTVDRGQHR